MPAVPASTPSLGDIQSAAGGASPASLSEYYAGSGYVWAYGAPTAAGDYGAIPASGAISIGVFRNKFFFKATIAANTTNYNIYNAAVAAGFAPGTHTLIAIITVNSGVYVYATSTGVYAMDTGTGYTKGASIHIINNGVIAGRGGAGGIGGTSGVGTAGSAGGPALRAQVPIVVSNYGTIGAGGGGGGGAGGYLSGKTYVQCGGGGGGRVLGVGAALNGVTATLAAAGAGGTANGGTGGAGGNLGAAGGTGQTRSFAGGAGGPTSSYIVGNGNVTWNVTGSRLGNVG